MKYDPNISTKSEIATSSKIHLATGNRSKLPSMHTSGNCEITGQHEFFPNITPPRNSQIIKIPHLSIIDTSLRAKSRLNQIRSYSSNLVQTRTTRTVEKILFLDENMNMFNLSMIESLIFSSPITIDKFNSFLSCFISCLNFERCKAVFYTFFFSFSFFCFSLRGLGSINQSQARKLLCQCVFLVSQYYSTVCCIIPFSQCPTSHESRHFLC